MLDLCRCTQSVSHAPGVIPGPGQHPLSRPRPLDLEFIRTLTRRRPGLDRNTLHLSMEHHGIKCKYSDIDNTDLDSLVMEFKRRRPESGVHYIIGFLWKNGIRVQYLRVVHSLQRVDRLGQVLRDRWVKAKCKYHITIEYCTGRGYPCGSRVGVPRGSGLGWHLSTPLPMRYLCDFSFV